jgi:phytol kinase
MNPFLATLITFGLSLVWLRLNDFIAHKGWIGSDLSRKIIHTGTGPLFVLCWLLFPDVLISRFLAALVPLAITAQFFLVGSGILKDEAAVRAMSRSGDRREILRGPLYYGVAFILLTLIFWKSSPAGIVALMLMCGGDGLADIAGRRYSSACLPWNREKSTAGSLAMFLGGFIFALVILGVYVAAGVFPGPLTGYLPGLLLIAVVGTIVESLPFKDIDNITVTTTAAILGYLLWK